jgi:hypothetical protein
MAYIIHGPADGEILPYFMGSQRQPMSEILPYFMAQPMSAGSDQVL